MSGYHKDDGKYVITFVDNTTREHWGRPIVADGVLHIVHYTGGASLPELEDGRVSFGMANVKSWEKIG